MVPILRGVGIEVQLLLYRLELCPGDESGSARDRLGRVPALPRSVVLLASTVELATVDIVCADVMKGPPTSYQV